RRRRRWHCCGDGARALEVRPLEIGHKTPHPRAGLKVISELSTAHDSGCFLARKLVSATRKERRDAGDAAIRERDARIGIAAPTVTKIAANIPTRPQGSLREDRRRRLHGSCKVGGVRESSAEKRDQP